MANKKDFKIFYAISLAWQLGFSIIFSMIGFLALGIYSDRKFQSSPLFLIIAIILSIITIGYEIRHLFRPLMDKISHEEREDKENKN